MSAEIQSRPYQPNPELCCEACVFGRAQHTCARGTCEHEFPTLGWGPVGKCRKCGIEAEDAQRH